MPIIRRKNDRAKKKALIRLQLNLSNYIETLVHDQPEWLQALFETQKVFFTVEDNNELALGVEANLDEEVKSKIQETISNYFEKNPTDFLVSKNCIQ